jgi:hypothetical protein
MENPLWKFVIYKTKDVIWICPSRDYNRIVYEWELHIKEMCFILASVEYIKYLISLTKEQVAKELLMELENNIDNNFSN